MFANLIIDNAEQTYRYNERESAAAFAAVEKVADIAGVLMQVVRTLRAEFSGRIFQARA